MTRVVSPRFQISYPHPTLRDEDADVPGDLKLLVDGIELAAKYGQGTLGARPAAGTTAPTIYYATDAAQVYWNTGSTWVTIGPPGTDSITAVQITANAVGTAELADGAVDTAAIQNGAINSLKLAPGNVDNVALQDNAVSASKLADNAVDTAAILANAVTGVKIAPDSIGAAHILADAVGTSEIAPNSVGAVELADNAVDTNAIANGAITSPKLSVTPGLILARRGSAMGMSPNTWTNLWWDTLIFSEGTTFWNGSDAFDLLEVGWHHIIANVGFDTDGIMSVRIINMSAGGQVIAEQGPVYQSGLGGGRLSVTYETYSGPAEYLIQVFNSNGGAVQLYGQTPLLTARVER